MMIFRNAVVRPNINVLSSLSGCATSSLQSPNLKRKKEKEKRGEEEKKRKKEEKETSPIAVAWKHKPLYISQYALTWSATSPAELRPLPGVITWEISRPRQPTVV